MKHIILATAAALILGPTIALAHETHSSIQYNGPIEVASLDALLADNSLFVEKKVVVDGNIVRQISADTYLFSDGKNEIQISIDDDIRLNQPIDPDTSLRIFGEFEGGRTAEIDVDRIQLL
ncbi:YgiW/YdeI family stress tolerance OB fold protein [Vibrio ostreicida]|uniref:NirD/YgiW/YdeI family stress tolerance protein n=1 Tax=Vibrio ostreicida TaxID=526588 RepID=A0ABT8BZ73_9VIBR|nr:NirD/YgiW/YdeI family stress tolerance protein [Vibrio ostreicida]MDN3611676.1 NirD/YgiW/YdeI family stress tolerance protein [Vibrio ostreicida]NPD10125.1 NirD/YgiW/YdeI family stress tolerance protein [Vibrio ostreicida]